MDAPWQGLPRDGVTVHHLTDTHVVDPGGTAYGWVMPRLSEIGRDMVESEMLAGVAGRLHTGDITEHGEAGEVADALSWLNQYWADPTDVLVYGNHDYGNGWASWAKSAVEVEADYGRPRNGSVYLGPAGAQLRVLWSAPDADPEGGQDWTMSAETMSWLDSQLSADATTPTFLANHFMLNELPDNSGEARPTFEFTDLISAHAQVGAWVCGHAHYEITDARCVTELAVGNRARFPHICGPSPSHTNDGSGGGYAKDAKYPYNSLFLTYRGPDRLEVRYRNHGARQWVSGMNGEQVTILNPGG